MEWININDRRPEDGQKVLTWNTRVNDSYLQVYNEYYQCWDDEDGDDFEFNLDSKNDDGTLIIEYWAPLPDSPYNTSKNEIA